MFKKLVILAASLTVLLFTTATSAQETIEKCDDKLSDIPAAAADELRQRNQSVTDLLAFIGSLGADDLTADNALHLMNWAVKADVAILHVDADAMPTCDPYLSLTQVYAEVTADVYAISAQINVLLNVPMPKSEVADLQELFKDRLRHLTIDTGIWIAYFDQVNQ